MEAYKNVYGMSNHIVIIKGKQPLIAMDLINPAAAAAAAAEAEAEAEAEAAAAEAAAAAAEWLISTTLMRKEQEK